MGTILGFLSKVVHSRLSTAWQLPRLDWIRYCDPSVSHKKVNSMVGSEASSTPAYALSLNADKKPHNPFTNGGAISLASTIGATSDNVTRISTTLSHIKNISNKAVGCSMPTYLSMLSGADRDISLAYWLVRRFSREF